jgi:hypothetical protein
MGDQVQHTFLPLLELARDMPVNMETMVQQSCDFVGTARLNL